MHICTDCATTPFPELYKLLESLTKDFLLLRGWSGHSLWQTATFLAVGILLVEKPHCTEQLFCYNTELATQEMTPFTCEAKLFPPFALM